MSGSAKQHARRGAKAQRSRPSATMRAAPRAAKPTLTGNAIGFHPSVIAHAEALLAEVLQFDLPADVKASRYFKANPILGHRDRGLIAESVFAVLRRKLEFAQLAQSGTGSLTRRMILLGLAETAGVEPIASTLDSDERTWLRRVGTIDRSTMPLATRSNLPEWLFTALRKRFSEVEVEAIAAVLNRPAPLDLRVNTMMTSRDDALQTMRAAGLGSDATALAPNGIRLHGKPALGAQKIFLDGRVEVQDEGSQLLAALVAPKRGELVIDFCAGAGGKTLALGDLMRSTGRLYAFDISAKRLARLKPRLARSGLSNVHPVLIESERDAKLKRMVGKADRVLIDAPCSGLGTLRRNPDLKWRQQATSIAELAQKQASILESASRLVKPGGRLVYATCSLLREENQDIVDAFIAAHAEFEIESATDILLKQGIELGTMVDANVSLELWPHRTGTDGFFAAVFRKRAAAPVAVAVVEAVEPDA
jgi:16S rRNA (cytosine967-C5)-methyltransferase